MVGNNEMKRVGSIQFILEPGASDHLANESWYISNLNKLDNPVEINIAKDNVSELAKSCGDINCTTECGYEIQMKNVLFAPDLRENLMSVRKLTKAGAEVKFLDNKAIIIYVVSYM